MRRGKLFLVLCLVSHWAFADVEEDKKQAQTLRTQAIELAKLDNCKEAIKLFQKAYDVNKEMKDLYNMGTCQINIEKYADAFVTYELYLTRLSLDDAELRLNEEQLKSLAKKLQRPEVQKANKTKSKALLELTESLSTKADNLPALVEPPTQFAVLDPDSSTQPATTQPSELSTPASQVLEATSLPVKDAPSKPSRALPFALVGVAALSMAAELGLEAKSQSSGETNDTREFIRVGLVSLAGISLVTSGALLVLRRPKSEVSSVSVSASLNHASVWFSF